MKLRSLLRSKPLSPIFINGDTMIIPKYTEINQ